MRESAGALAIVVLLVAGCNGGKSESGGKSENGASLASAPRNPGGSGSANVTFRPNVQVVEQRDGMNALVSVSTDGSTLVFDRSQGAMPALKVGDVLVIKGLLARKIIAAETNGDETAVLTVPAGLVEIVADGKIHVEAPIRFGSPQSVAVWTPLPSRWESLTNGFVPLLYAQAPTEERRKSAEQKGVRDAYGNMARAPFKAVMSGWETEFSAVPAAGRLNLLIKLKKSAGNVAAVVTGQGYLADFDFSSDIDIERSTVERLQIGYKKLNGVMNFTWEVQTTEGGQLRGNASMKLPAAIEIPLYQYLGGLPLFLEISSAVIIKPALGAGYEFSRGSFRVTYDGYQTFRVKEGIVDSDGNVTGDIKLVAADNGSGAPIGMVVAFAAPRIELSIGVSKVLKFDGVKEAAAKADKYFDILVKKTFGAEALQKFKNSPMSKVTATKIADAAMGSDAAAYIQLTTSSGMSHTGNAVMVPCTRTDLHMTVKVGASANAFGQSVGDTDKEIYKKDFTRVKPSENALCAGI